MKEIVKLKASGDIDRASELLYQLCEQRYSENFPLNPLNEVKFRQACKKAILDNEGFAILGAAKGYLVFILEFPDLTL